MPATGGEGFRAYMSHGTERHRILSLSNPSLPSTLYPPLTFDAPLAFPSFNNHLERLPRRRRSLTNFEMSEPRDVTALIEQTVSRFIGEGLLDDQFRQLMRLQNETSPDFITEVVDLFFFESKRRLQRFAGFLNQEEPDFKSLDQGALDFKGSSASFGAKAITDLCDVLRAHCKEKDLDNCREALANQRAALGLLEQRMEEFLELETERKQASGVSPPSQGSP